MKVKAISILVCSWTECASNRGLKIYEALEKEVLVRGLGGRVSIGKAGCLGFCERGPVILFEGDGVIYQRVKEEDITRICEDHLLKGNPVQDLLYIPPEEPSPIPKLMDITFFKNQLLIALRNRGRIDPENIDEYIANDGYTALAKALREMTPEEII